MVRSRCFPLWRTARMALSYSSHKPNLFPAASWKSGTPTAATAFLSEPGPSSLNGTATALHTIALWEQAMSRPNWKNWRDYSASNFIECVDARDQGHVICSDSRRDCIQLLDKASYKRLGISK